MLNSECSHVLKHWGTIVQDSKTLKKWSLATGITGGYPWTFDSLAIFSVCSLCFLTGTECDCHFILLQQSLSCRNGPNLKL